MSSLSAVLAVTCRVNYSNRQKSVPKYGAKRAYLPGERPPFAEITFAKVYMMPWLAA